MFETMISASAAAWLRLSMLPGVGPVTGRKLVQAAGSAEALWQLDIRALKAIQGVGPQLLAVLQSSRSESADEVIAVCRQQEIGLLCPDDTAWPQQLALFDDAPLMLFYRGDVHSLLSPRMLAVVGARRASREGTVITRRWSRYISERGICIVSGMAYGIDAAAHAGALDAQAATVAVLGCGLAALSELQQAQAEAITPRGCVLSEFLPVSSARPEHFPRRNRIIAALSHAALVMEADVRSGSLITARQALAYGRDLFAVPGSVLSANHAGCHQLIRDGAMLVEKPDDLLQSMDWLQPRSGAAGSEQSYCPADAEELLLLQALRTESMHLDHLAESCGLTVPELSPILLRLELQGVVERLPGSRYLLACAITDSTR